MTGRQGGKRRVGAVRSRRRGLGPARLDGQAPLATVAEKAMNLGKAASGLRARALRRINAARRAPLHAQGMPDWIGLADQTLPGRRFCRGAKHRAAGMVCKTIPWRASAARRPARPQASGIKAEWPRRATRRGATPASPPAERRDARQRRNQTLRFLAKISGCRQVSIRAAHTANDYPGSSSFSMECATRPAEQRCLLR